MSVLIVVSRALSGLLTTLVSSSAQDVLPVTDPWGLTSARSNI